MKQRRSMLMAILLTLAMVFTMMPAMVWADAAVTPSKYNFYQAVDGLSDGEFVIVAQDKALTAPVVPEGSYSNSNPVKLDGNNATDVTPKSGMLVDPTAATVWTYTASSKKFSTSYGDAGKYYGEGSLYFSSTGLKYQSEGYRQISYNADKQLTAPRSSSGSSSSETVGLTFDGTAFGSKLTTEATPAAVTLYKRVYAVDFDVNGHGTAPDRQYVDGKVALPDVKAEGYKLNAWLDENGKEWDPDTAVTKNMVLKADWEVDPVALKEAKDAANAELDKVDRSKYDKADQDTINAYITVAREEIAKAGTVEAVNAAMVKFNADVANVPTSADKKKAEDDAAKVQATKVQIKKPSVGKKKVTAKWVANAAVFEGYQVQYKINKKGKKWKSKTVANGAASKKVIKKLKKGKKYKVRVRGYKTINGVKVYGPWSKTKTTKKVK
jgi:hypothetical protein